mmetsp:Transcript_15836/g.38905  ORF Transcript_15836/g.38905 Transcript_15836/m.38905 type:complete len:205 (+) Transcript_15836:219-833(+)
MARGRSVSLPPPPRRRRGRRAHRGRELGGTHSRPCAQRTWAHALAWAPREQGPAGTGGGASPRSTKWMYFQTARLGAEGHAALEHPLLHSARRGRGPRPRTQTSAPHQGTHACEGAHNPCSNLRCSMRCATREALRLLGGPKGRGKGRCILGGSQGRWTDVMGTRQRRPQAPTISTRECPAFTQSSDTSQQDHTAIRPVPAPAA